MDKGWIKSYRKIINHPLLANDNSCFIVFMKILHVVDKNDGHYITGRFKMAELCNLKPTTGWEALKRLEKHKMVSLESDNKKTTIYICNWSKYQGGTDSKAVNKPSTNRQQGRQQTVTKQEEEVATEQELETLTSPQTATRRVYDFFIQSFGKNPKTLKLTTQRALKIKQRLKDFTEDEVKQAITNAANDDFFNGGGERGWIGTIDYLFRSTEIMEKYAHKSDTVSTIDKSRVNQYV